MTLLDLIICPFRSPFIGVRECVRAFLYIFLSGFLSFSVSRGSLLPRLTTYLLFRFQRHASVPIQTHKSSLGVVDKTHPCMYLITTCMPWALL